MNMRDTLLGLIVSLQFFTVPVAGQRARPSEDTHADNVSPVVVSADDETLNLLRQVVRHSEENPVSPGITEEELRRRLKMLRDRLQKSAPTNAAPLAALADSNGSQQYHVAAAIPSTAPPQSGVQLLPVSAQATVNGGPSEAAAPATRSLEARVDQLEQQMRQLRAAMARLVRTERRAVSAGSE